MTAATEKKGTESEPEPLLQMGMSFTSARTLAAGVQLNVFSHLAARRRTAAEVARAAGASERGTGMLLDALTGLELLTETGARYQLTPKAARYLVRESPDYVGGMMENDSLIPNDERTGPVFALLFALNMLVNTQEGGTYTLAEYIRWLTEAGFPRVTRADIGLHSPLVIGGKG
jgi:hypothetical protein